jgi:hypothetical protein
MLAHREAKNQAEKTEEEIPLVITTPGGSYNSEKIVSGF